MNRIKPRRVMISAEVETSWTMAEIREWIEEQFTLSSMDLLQVQVNVIQPAKPQRPKNRVRVEKTTKKTAVPPRSRRCP